MTAVKWVFSFLKKYRKRMAAGLLMTTGIAMLTIVNPYISGVIVDDVIGGGQRQLLPDRRNSGEGPSAFQLSDYV